MVLFLLLLSFFFFGGLGLHAIAGLQSGDTAFLFDFDVVFFSLVVVGMTSVFVGDALHLMDLQAIDVIKCVT